MAMRHLTSLPEAARALDGIRGRSLLRAANLTSAEVHATFTVARVLREGQLRTFRPLADRIVCTAFFEPSTRTRLSFESAALRLGASTLSIPDGRVTGAAKGETLADIGRMLQAYADLVVLRHPDPQCLQEIRRCGLTLPIINGGNGQQEHPTQALSDWFTLTETFPDDETLHVGVVGVPANMRTLRSFLLLGLAVFPRMIRRLTVVSERQDCLDAELVAAARAAGVPIQVREDLTRLAPDLDVVYVNALTNVNGRYELMNRRFRLSTETPLKPTCRILHPLARGPELDVSLDDTAHNLYFRQADSAVFIRQAVLLATLGRVPELVDRNGTARKREPNGSSDRLASHEPASRPATPTVVA